MRDTLTPAQRSERMSRVKPTGNRSTEERVERALIDANITGWTKHQKLTTGRPDFYFEEYRLAVFVDGCFWHDCPVCKRRRPTTRATFWHEKIEANRKRDNRQRRKMRKEGYHVMRIWEHEVKADAWLRRLRGMLTRLENARQARS